MANVLPYDQGQMAHSGAIWPPPAIMESRRGGRHRKPVSTKTGSTPAAIPPHPPLMSGGWYSSLGDVLGPGRYPVQRPVDKSVGIALLLGVLFGPAGISYTSITGGLIACGVTAIALIVFGFVSLLVIWPLAVGAAVTSAVMRHRWYART